MKKPIIWAVIAIIAVVAIRVVWVQLSEPEGEIQLIANPYNTAITD